MNNLKRIFTFVIIAILVILITPNAYSQDISGNRVHVIAWNSIGTQFAAGYQDGTIKIYDHSGQILQTLVGHWGIVFDVAWNSDGSQLASASQDKRVRIWDVDSGTPVNILTGHEDGVTAVMWLDDNQIASGSIEDIANLRIWDVNSSILLNVERNSGSIWDLLLDVGNERIIVINPFGIAIFYDAVELSTKAYLRQPEGMYQALWVEDSSQLITGSLNGIIRIWDEDNETVLFEAEATDNQLVGFDTTSVRAMLFQDHILTSVAADGTLRSWNIIADEMLSEITLADFVTAAAFNFDGSTLAYSDENNAIETMTLLSAAGTK